MRVTEDLFFCIFLDYSIFVQRITVINTNMIFLEIKTSLFYLSLFTLPSNINIKWKEG